MSTTALEKPWLHVELHKDSKARSLSDEVVEILDTLFTNDLEDALALATAPDREDSPSGDPYLDRVFLAGAVKKLATDAHPQVQAVKAKQIMPLLNRCCKRIGVDRMAIAAKKREFLALEGSEPADEQSVDDQSPNTRRDMADGSTDSTQPE